LDKVANCQAFHFKGGQGAKTGTGGHLPGEKVVGKIAEVRGLEPGTPAISPSTFKDLFTTEHFRNIADQVREVSGGIPIGFKMSAQHIEADIDFALEATADYIILDGRGGGTGAAPEIFKKNISIPTMIALARARRHLDSRGRKDEALLMAQLALSMSEKRNSDKELESILNDYSDVKNGLDRLYEKLNEK